MFFRINAPDIRPAAGRIGKRIMAPEAEVPCLINSELGRVGGVPQSRPMAVLAGDNGMGGCHDAFVLVGMAILAVVGPLIFDSHLFPVVDIGGSVPSIHISPLMDAETCGDVEEPDDKDKDDKTEYYPERSENVTFHRLHLIN
jgi:hypothetical protein